MSDAFGIQPVPDVARQPAFPPYQAAPNAPTADQLALPYQRVRLKNTDPACTHIMIDRHLQGHVLQPGQSCEIEMTTGDITNLLNLARTDRGIYTAGPNVGKPFPPHPVKLEGLTPIKTDPKREAPIGAPVLGAPVVQQPSVEAPRAAAEAPQPRQGPPPDQDRRNQQPQPQRR